MSSSRVSRAAAAVVLAFLAGCGFKPLYGTNSATHAPATAVQFAQIEIPPLPNETGQELRNMLIDQLHPGGPADDYRYTLKVALREADLNLGLQENATATRGQVRLTAEYWLTDAENGKVLVHETVRTSTGYNILINQFGTVLSTDDARNRGLQQIADEMALHLALYFQADQKKT
ncbi:MAG TPA: LPS assembly lipoprotein LptE [Alphaproteobacteria bacterium]|nr:LPS assembly lipoprotein LptE [Alphaproteobacteria bacterium]